jgi:phospholipid transport system substrate-binding protein
MKTAILKHAALLILLALPHLLAAAELTPDEIVVATTQEVLFRLDKDRERLQAEPAYIKQMVRELIVPHFDFGTMAGLVLGRDWRIMNADVRECFTSAFRNLLVERYSDILLSYRDQNIKYAPARPVGRRGYVSVLQTLTKDDRKPLTISYRMRPEGEIWSVVDLVVDDVSLVRSYRRTFTKQIKELGLAEFIYGLEECKN